MVSSAQLYIAILFVVSQDQTAQDQSNKESDHVDPYIPNSTTATGDEQLNGLIQKGCSKSAENHIPPAPPTDIPHKEQFSAQ